MEVKSTCYVISFKIPTDRRKEFEEQIRTFLKLNTPSYIKGEKDTLYTDNYDFASFVYNLARRCGKARLHKIRFVSRLGSRGPGASPNST